MNPPGPSAECADTKFLGIEDPKSKLCQISIIL